jgi:uncharacterized protein YjbI with pentapeptide repeats
MAHFHESDLRRASFEGAWILDTDFSAADMDYWAVPWAGAEEQTADGLAAVLKDNHGYGASVILTSFRNAHASRAGFDGACLRGVNFTDTLLDDATFENADLSLAVLRGDEHIDPKSAFSKSCAYPAAPDLQPGAKIREACFNEGSATSPNASGSALPTRQCEVPLFKGFKRPKNDKPQSTK